MRYVVFFGLMMLMGSCRNTKESSVAYFGGEIINPNSRYLILYKNNEVVDSAVLDDTNHFLIKLRNPEEGLYHFEHQPEYQYVFIEKGDSISIRLNTMDFDESLVFSGRGAEKNNFLIDMFLVNEDEESLISQYYHLEAGVFREKMDSLFAMKYEQYKNLLAAGYSLSENAQNIAKAAIDYPHYTAMELYPYLHKKRNNLAKIPRLSRDFYAYRGALQTNDGRLSYYKPYFNYMVMKMNNLSYAACTKNCEDGMLDIKKSFHYHLHKLHLIDSLVSEPELRDNLFRNAAYTYILEDRNADNNKRFMETFYTVSKNNKYIEEIRQLYASIKQLQPGMFLPALSVIAPDSVTVVTSDIAQKANKVYYFWSVNQEKHLINSLSKIKKLQEKFPYYAFIGINVNDQHKKWLQLMEKNEMDGKNQFRTDDFKKLTETWVINNLNKAILVKADGVIIDAFANLNDKRMEDSLMAYNPK